MKFKVFDILNFKKNNNKKLDIDIVAPQEQNQKKSERKYYEIFGNLVRADNFKTTVIITLLGIILCLIVLLWNLMHKLPIVIRIMPNGGIESFQNAVSYQNTSKPEVINFCKTFLEYYTEWNFYSYENDLNNAEFMMTEKMASIASVEIKAGNIVDKIKKDKLKTTLLIKSITVLKDTSNFISVRITGRRNIVSYEDVQYKKEEGFDIELAIIKVERTIEHPYGLLVDNYKETQY
jgi:hypothetical protein